MSELTLPLTPPVELTVYGLPVPKGSMKAFKDRAGHVRTVHTAAGPLASWSNEIAVEARAAADLLGGALQGPVELSVIFRFPMPKSRPVRLRVGAPFKETAPDLDKLVRAVGDALTVGGLLRDDSQIVQFGECRKVEVWEQWIGATIRVTALAPQIVGRRVRPLVPAATVLRESTIPSPSASVAEDGT